MSRSANSPLSTLCTVLGTVMVAAALLLALAMALPSLLGWQQLTVLSGSMQPAIPVGAMVYVQPMDPAQLAAGDVVTYVANGSPVTHRVVENNAAEKLLVTKGDANAQPDPAPVAYSAVEGRAAFWVPVLGSVLGAFSTALGKACLLALGAGGVVLTVLGGRLRRAAEQRD